MFLVVYQREPHAGQMAFKEIRQPETYRERCALARRTVEELELKSPFLIDTMEDLSRALFGDLPSPAIVIGPDGVIRAKLPWSEPDKLAPALKLISEAKEFWAEVSTHRGDPRWILREGLAFLASAENNRASHLLWTALQELPESDPLFPVGSVGYARVLRDKGDHKGSRLMLDQAMTAARKLWANDAPRRAAFFATAAEALPDRDPAVWEEIVRLSESPAPRLQLAWALEGLAKALEGEKKKTEAGERAEAIRREEATAQDR